MKFEELTNPSINDILKEMPYGIVVLEGNVVVHVCLYENFPTQIDCELLVDELKVDSELGLVGKDFTKFTFHPASGQILENAINVFNGEEI